MSQAMTTLETLRDAFAAVEGVVTSRIGLEANMTAEDYPMVRIVPSKVSDASVIGRRRTEALIYFGKPVHEFTEGLEALYAELFDMEAALIDAARLTPGLVFDYRETILDEDRIDAYKLMAIRATIEG